MKLLYNQRGSVHLLLFLGIGVILAVGVVGYRISQNDTHLAGNAPVVSSQTPKTLKSTADLKKADKALDATAIDGDVNPNQLDEDLNAVL